MIDQRNRRKVINRRAFLYGAGTIAIGLPFLEGLQERSAWAATDKPIFTFFVCGACGVEPKKFWPASTGPLSGLLASGKAVDALSAEASRLLIVKGINYPLSGPSGCGHAQGLAQALTGKTPTGSGSQATATGPSVDFVISQAVNPTGTDPMTLYAGNLRNGFIADRLSFDASSRVRASVDNPYKLYQKLTGLAAPAGSSGGSTGNPAPVANPQAEELIAKRKSVNDTIRAELNSLIQNPKLSAADKLRLQQDWCLMLLTIFRYSLHKPIFLRYRIRLQGFLWHKGSYWTEAWSGKPESNSSNYYGSAASPAPEDSISIMPYRLMRRRCRTSCSMKIRLQRSACWFPWIFQTGFRDS